VKRLLGGSHNEQFVVINNESLQPTHWQSFYALADGISVNAVGVGININTSSETEQKNLEDRNLQVFKASMYKYYEVENLDDVESVVNDILSKLEPKT
jgi:DhnA family fructose-bisphosphate aldolase class Ia